MENKIFTVTDTLWQDPRDPKGELTCRVCEAGVNSQDYDSHIAIHNAEGWMDLSKRKPGRPRKIFPEDVATLRAAPERFTWKEIAAKLRVSESSVIRVFRPYRRKGISS